MEGEKPKEDQAPEEDSELEMGEPNEGLSGAAIKPESSELELDEDLTPPEAPEKKFKYGEHKEDVEHSYEVRAEKLKAAIKELEEYLGLDIKTIRNILSKDALERKQGAVITSGTGKFGIVSFNRIKDIVDTLDRKSVLIESMRKDEREAGLRGLAEQI